MTLTGLLRVFGVAAFPLAFSVVLPAQAGDMASIQAKLATQFKVTRVAADRSDIVTAGDVVQLHKPGLVMYAVTSPLPPSNSYKNGKIGQGMGGFGKDLLIGMATPGAGTAYDYPHRTFAPDEKCWITGFQAQKDGVLIQVYSDPYDGVRYYANLKIPYPNKKEIPSVDTAMQLVAEVLTVVPPDNQGAQPEQGGQAAGISGPAADSTQSSQQVAIPGEYSAPGGSRILLLPDGSFTKFVAGGQGKGQYTADGDTLTLTFSSTGFVQKFKTQGGNLLDLNTNQVWARTGDAPLQEIAPPPPPTDTPPQTISLGQTEVQVTAALGQPIKVAKIGTKVIFYFKDMKVTFLNGKVSNVE